MFIKSPISFRYRTFIVLSPSDKNVRKNSELVNPRKQHWKKQKLLSFFACRNIFVCFNSYYSLNWQELIVLPFRFEYWRNGCFWWTAGIFAIWKQLFYFIGVLQHEELYPFFILPLWLSRFQSMKGKRKVCMVKKKFKKMNFHWR